MTITPQDFATRETPLQAADRFGAALGFAPGALWIKRDDLTGLAGGGNKARKLEYVCTEAVISGADILVTGGSMPQSNQISAVAAAANRIGMRTRAVLPGPVPSRLEGNLVPSHLLGVEYVWLEEVPTQGMQWAIHREVEQLLGRGHRPYEIPLGVSSPVGSLGYVTAALEIEAQAPDRSIVYHATGTGGTQAGLAVGFGEHARVRGVDTGTPWNVAEVVDELSVAVAQVAGREKPCGEAEVLTDQVGRGYGVPTEQAREAIELLARTEGILCEPIYTGKALAGLIADRRSGRLAPDQATVFLHTGGMSLLYTSECARWLSQRS